MILKHLTMASAVVSLVALSSEAFGQTGPDGIRYDCDTAANHFSELVLPAGPAPFLVTGKLKLMAAAESLKFIPTTRLTVSNDLAAVSSDLSWAGFEYMVAPTEAGKPAALPFLAFSSKEPGGKNDIQLIGPPSAAEVSFSVSFDGTHVAVIVDGHEKQLEFATGKPVVRLICSTGEFLYSELRIRPID